MKIINNLKFKINNSIKGFTLIELLIVIAIIGVLSTLLMANFIGVRQRARDAQRKSDIRQLQSALEIYRSDNGGYPLTASVACPNSLTATVNGSAVTYMTKVPCDPTNTSPFVYKYTVSGVGNTGYTISSCLENVNDSQKDKFNVAPCNGTTSWSFTVNNP